MLPLLVHYLETATIFGYRNMFEVGLAAPVLGSWLYMGPDSWLYAWLPRYVELVPYGMIEPAHRIGVGLVTPLVCAGDSCSGG